MTEAAGISGRLVPGGHDLPVRVYFEDTDFSGFVYHASYLRFMERGRSDFMRLVGVHHRPLAAGAFGEPLVFAVRHMAIDYLKPARIDDLLTVETRTEGVHGARIRLAQQVTRDGEVLVKAAVTVVILSPDGRPRRMPARLRAALGLPAEPAS